jgi:hypothetical protein
VAIPLFQTVSAIHSVNQPPPLVRMESVQLLTNKKHQVKEVIVSFSGALESARAQNTAEYRLVKAGKRGSFTVKHAKLIKLRSAVYNGSSDTVTLSPNKPFRLTKPVQLQVIGEPPSGLDDTLGRPIDGNHGVQPGGNAVVVLQRSRATVSTFFRGPSSIVARASVRIRRS